MSLIETAVALLIFSLSVAMISNQVNRDVGGVDAMQHKIAEVYHHGL